MRTTAFILFFLLGLCTVACFSQQYNIRSYSFPQGLFTYNIKKTLQDKYGFTWIATQDGVFRFDGNSFESFKNSNTDTSSILGNFIFDMVLGDGESIYIPVFNGGIDVINSRTLKVTHLLSRASPKEITLPNLWITKIFFDHKKQLWIGGKDYLVVYNTISKKIKHIEPPKGFEGNLNVSFIKSVDENTIAVGTESYGILIFDTPGFKLKGIINKLDYETINSEITASDMVVHSGNCYISSGSSVYSGKINNGKWILGKKYSPPALQENVISCLEFYKDAELWIGTNTGAGHLNLRNEDFYFLSDRETTSKENLIYHLFIDKTNNLWISSLNNLQMVNLDPSPFRAYTEDQVGKVKMNHLYALVPKNDNEIFGCGTDGLYLCNTVSGSVQKISGTGSLGIIHYLRKTDDDFWIVCTDFGMYGYKSSKGIISKELLLKKYPEWTAFADQYFNNTVTVGKKIYWASELQQGLLVWDIEKHLIKNYKAGTSDSKGIPENHIHNIKMDKDGFIWMMFDNNVAKYDPVKDTVIKVFPYELNSKTFNAGIFFDMYDDGSVLWFGTYGGGINGYNKKTGEWTYITEQDGLCNNAVYGILPEKDSIFWVSTNNGLSRVNYKTRKCVNYFKENGLQDNSFDETGSLQWNNKLFFSGINGLTAVDVAQYNSSPYPFPVYIKKVEYISKKRKIVMNDLAWHQLELPAGTSTATIWLSALSYAGNKPAFNYKIKGFQNEFIPVSNDNKIELNALTKGVYQIDIRYQNEKGDLVTGVLGISLEVLPFWYETWWFRIVVAIFLAGLAFYIGRLIYLNHIRKQKALLEKQLAVQYERQRISAEMHDDIGAGLSGIKLMTEIAEQKMQDEEAAVQMKKIHSSVGEISSKMKEVIWSLNTENDKLDNLLSYIQRQVRIQLENYHCQVSVRLPDRIPDIAIGGDMRRNIYLVVKESVHNIIKHSGADKVKISISSTDKLIITVADNGKGMAKEKNQTGNGLRNMQQRLKMMGGEMIINSHDGTTLIFTIPLKAPQ